MRAHIFEDKIPALYAIANYIGQVLAWEELSGGVITIDKCISDILAVRFQSIFKLYYLLAATKDFESAKDIFQKIIELKDLMEDK